MGKIDFDALRRELKSYRSEWEVPAERAILIEAALPRIAATLSLLPPASAGSRLLELGADPFLTTLCAEHLWPGSITLACYPKAGQTHGSSRMVNVAGGPDKVLEFDTFNVETDEFPYPDATFEAVIFSELIEHLAMNPVWTLSEIHRVLKPGGHVIITTPNALALERLDIYLFGGSSAVDRYMPLNGYGARHNREWHPVELQELLGATGFVIEELTVRDLERYDLRTRLRRARTRLLLRWWSNHSHRSHIFLRARRGDVFHWAFPARLYDHMAMYHVARHPYVEMGVNDTIQCGAGWQPLERDRGNGGPERGQPVRRIAGAQLEAQFISFARAHLRGDPAATRLVVRLRATSETGGKEVAAAVRVCPPNAEHDALIEHHFTVPAGAWMDFAVPLTRRAREREELEFHLRVPPGCEMVVRRFALE